jgi:sensor histidine kinase YesM
MKKTFLLFVLICISTFKVVFAEQPLIQRIGFRPSISDTTNRNWAFVINRLFDGESNKVLKYDSDIHIRLTGNPRNSDSIIVSNLIAELKTTISTNNIILVKSGGNLILDFNNGPEIKNLSFKAFNGLGRDFRKLKSIKHNSDIPEKIKARLTKYDTLEYNYTAISFRFNDSLSYVNRKEYIEYEVIQSLCSIKLTESVNPSYNSKEPILNRPYNYNNPLNTQFSSLDKFLLARLYSVDFQNQIKNYIIKGSSCRSYMIFTNKSLMKSIGIFLVILLTILILLISYKPVFRRNFKRQYYDYLIRGLVLSSSVYIILQVFLFFTSPMVSHDLIMKFINLIFYVIAATILISTPLYFIEKLIIKPNLSIPVQSGLKVFFILSIFLVLSFISNHFTLSISKQLTDIMAIGIILTIGRGILMFIDYSDQLTALTSASEISKLKDLRTEAEIHSLNSRINPHFLYNSLNSIAGLAHNNPDKTEKMALALSDLFRYNINRKDEPFGKIKDELEMVRSYMEVEQIRFGDRLNYTIDISEGLEEKKISRFILQPLVENAIIHGISKIETKGKISISINEIDNDICLTVMDNGPHFPENLVSGYGLQSIFDLLNLLYGDKAKIDWKNLPEKYIKIVIPKNKA